jgi:SAM-dependent methyltransferase
MNRRGHWEGIYTTKGDGDLSWFESVPAVSLAMLEAAGLQRDTCVIDVGAGDSRLVDELTARGLTCLAVLDVSGAALARAQARLGDRAPVPVWIEADVTGSWSAKPMDIWHDRAVFHFLIDPQDRAKYVARLREVLKPGGAAIIATFAADGPERCSGLPVVRYSPERLAQELGDDFLLLESRPHRHETPWGAIQPFQYSRFVRRAS